MKAEVLTVKEDEARVSQSLSAALTPLRISLIAIFVCLAVIVMVIYHVKTANNFATTSDNQAQLVTSQALQVKPLRNTTTTDTASKATDLQAFNETNGGTIGASNIAGTSLGATSTPSLNTNTTSKPLGL